MICLLLGCGRPGLRAVIGDVELSSSALHFETAYLGIPKSRTLVLRNGSRGDRRVTTTTAAPFSAPSEVLVPGGAGTELTVIFTPVTAGSAAGTITVSDGAHTFDVSLDGEGVEVPRCIPSASCRLSAFDAASGQCVESLASDGSACASATACIEGGSCSKGACVGSARDCTDSNRCTEDACEPGGGCVHFPTVCGAPADPCKVASCDPTLGCVESDAQDGTACGPADCVTARVCLSGTCKSVAVPDGASCGPATPCQGGGTCQQQQCVRPPAVPLTEAWSYEFQSEIPAFRGVTDSAQNLFWVECVSNTCSAASVTRDGAVRFRQVLPEDANSVWNVPHLLAGSHLVYAVGTSIGSVSSSSGAVEWSLPLGPALLGAPDVADHFQVRMLAGDARAQVYALIQRYQVNAQGSSTRQEALLKIDSLSGTVVLRRFFDAETTGMVLDEHDNLYLGAWVNTLGPQLFSLSPSGSERFRLSVMADPSPLAVYNGEVTLRRGEVRSTLDGSVRATAPNSSGPLRNVLMSSTARTYTHQQQWGCCEACECTKPATYPEIDAISFPPAVAAANWDVPVAFSNGVGVWAAVSDSVAARQGDVLLAASSNPNLSALIALTTAGTQRYACEIPPSVPGSVDPSTYTAPTTLLSGRWAVVEQVQCRNCLRNPPPKLRVFEVPGVLPATRGWVSAGGGPSGGSRPLP